MVYATISRFHYFIWQNCWFLRGGHYEWKVGLLSRESGVNFRPQKGGEGGGQFGASVGTLLGAICSGESVEIKAMISVAMA